MWALYCLTAKDAKDAKETTIDVVRDFIQNSVSGGVMFGNRKQFFLLRALSVLRGYLLFMLGIADLNCSVTFVVRMAEATAYR